MILFGGVLGVMLIISLYFYLAFRRMSNLIRKLRLVAVEHRVEFLSDYHGWYTTLFDLCCQRGMPRMAKRTDDLYRSAQEFHAQYLINHFERGELLSLHSLEALKYLHRQGACAMYDGQLQKYEDLVARENLRTAQ